MRCTRTGWPTCISIPCRTMRTRPQRTARTPPYRTSPSPASRNVHRMCTILETARLCSCACEQQKYMLTACEQYAPLSPVSRWRRASPPHSCTPREWCRRRTPRSARSRRRRDCSSPERPSLCHRRAPRPRTSQATCWVVVRLEIPNLDPRTNFIDNTVETKAEPGRLRLYAFSNKCAVSPQRLPVFL